MFVLASSLWKNSAETIESSGMKAYADKVEFFLPSLGLIKLWLEFQFLAFTLKNTALTGDKQHYELFHSQAITAGFIFG